MKEQKSSSIKIISDAKAADTLINPKTLRMLEPFLAKDCTILEAAYETEEKANTVLSRIKRFMDYGLITITKEEKRAGRAIKHYRSTADIFFVPYEATTAESLEAMMAERDSYWEKLLRKAVVQTRIEDLGTWGTRIYKDNRGRLQVQTAVNPEENYSMLDQNQAAILSSWRDSVYLDFDDAKELQTEMFELLKRYQQKSGNQRYIIRLGMAAIKT